MSWLDLNCCVFGCRVSFYPEAGLYFVLVSKDGPHKQWLEEEEGGDMHAAYNYALAKAATQAKPKEYGFEVMCSCNTTK